MHICKEILDTTACAVWTWEGLLPWAKNICVSYFFLQKRRSGRSALFFLYYDH